MRSAVIVDVVRAASGEGKPRGSPVGRAPDAAARRHPCALVARSDLDPGTVDDVIAGCVSQAGEALNIARNSMLAAGMPESCQAPAWTAGAAPGPDGL